MVTPPEILAISIVPIDSALVEFILRTLSALVLLPAAYEVWKITQLIGNNSLADIMQRIALGILGFVLLRIVGANIDGYLGSGLPYTGYLTNAAFWFWVYYYMRLQRTTLAHEAIGEEGRRRVSQSIDEIIQEMKRVKRNNGY